MYTKIRNGLRLRTEVRHLAVFLNQCTLTSTMPCYHLLLRAITSYLLTKTELQRPIDVELLNCFNAHSMHTKHTSVNESHQCD